MPRKKKTVQEANIPEIKSELASKIDALETELEQVTSGTSTEKNQSEKKLTVKKSTKGKKKLTVTDEENKEIVSTEISAARKIFADEDDSVIEALEERIKQRKEEREKAEAEREAARVEKKEKTEIITLPYLVNEVSKYVRGQSTVEELNKLGDKINIITYIPILQKFSLAMMLVFNLNNEILENTEIKAISLQKHLFFDVLLNKYAMIDISEAKLCTYETYDLLYPVLAPYILQYCENDYRNFESIIKDTMNFNNIQEFGELLEKVDYKRLEKANEANVQALEELKKNQKLIKDLNKLLDNTKSENSKNLEQIVNQIALKKTIEK